MGLFDRFKKKSDGSECPFCGAKDITAVDHEPSIELAPDEQTYICNYCGKVFAAKKK
ncbi:MAG: hypothetical protein IKQ49_00410 [Eubacterium sp.]|nr:hypothetical protein [Eubacterium sp.]